MMTLMMSLVSCSCRAGRSFSPIPGGNRFKLRFTSRTTRQKVSVKQSSLKTEFSFNFFSTTKCQCKNYEFLVHLVHSFLNTPKFPTKILLCTYINNLSLISFLKIITTKLGDLKVVPKIKCFFTPPSFPKTIVKVDYKA